MRGEGSVHDSVPSLRRSSSPRLQRCKHARNLHRRPAAVLFAGRQDTALLERPRRFAPRLVTPCERSSVIIGASPCACSRDAACRARRAAS